MAAFAGRAPLPIEERIYEIQWSHDGEEWTATVGASLRGTRTQTRRINGERREVTDRLSDAARVLAIFSGVPYVVVTDARPLGHGRSRWSNPFMAGDPGLVRRFDPPTLRP